MRGTLTPRIEHNQGPGSHKRSGALSRPQPIPKPAPKSMDSPQHLALSSPCITRTVPAAVLLVCGVGGAVWWNGGWRFRLRTVCGGIRAVRV